MTDAKRQQKPVKNLQELQRNWDAMGRTDAFFYILTVPGKEHNRWDPDEFFASGTADITRLLEHLPRLGVSVPEGKALDFGCGVGRLTQALASRFSEAHGVDIAPSMIEQANSFNRVPEKCFFHLNPSNDLASFEDETFAFIDSLITLQHIAPKFMERYLLEFGRVLAPGGVAVFQLPVRRHYRWHLKQCVISLLRRIRPARPAPAESHSPQGKKYRNYTYQFFMKMYGLPTRRVRRLLAQNQVDLVAVIPDTSTGPEWISRLYVGVKRR